MVDLLAQLNNRRELLIGLEFAFGYGALDILRNLLVLVQCLTLPIELKQGYQRRLLFPFATAVTLLPTNNAYFSVRPHFIAVRKNRDS